MDTLLWVIISKIAQEWGLKWWLITLYSWSARLCNGGPQFSPSLCPCKYTIKWEIQRGKARVLVSMINKYACKWRWKLIYMITMQKNVKSNLWKEIKMQDLIYERKYRSKIIWKCKDETWWWKPWMHERKK